MKRTIVALALVFIAATASLAEDSDRTAYLKEHAKALQLESQVLQANMAARQSELQKDYDKTAAELKPILEAEKKAAAEAKKAAEKK